MLSLTMHPAVIIAIVAAVIALIAPEGRGIYLVFVTADDVLGKWGINLKAVTCPPVTPEHLQVLRL
jgi:hypothetical protein